MGHNFPTGQLLQLVVTLSTHLVDDTGGVVVEPEHIVNVLEVVDTIGRGLLYTTGQALRGGGGTTTSHAY